MTLVHITHMHHEQEEQSRIWCAKNLEYLPEWKNSTVTVDGPSYTIFYNGYLKFQSQGDAVWYTLEFLNQ